MTTTCKVKGSLAPGAMCGLIGCGTVKCHAEPNSCKHQSDYGAARRKITITKQNGERVITNQYKTISDAIAGTDMPDSEIANIVAEPVVCNGEL